MTLASSLGLELQQSSVVHAAGAEWALARAAAGRRLVVSTASDLPVLDEIEGERHAVPGGVTIVGPTTAHNAAVLRRHLPSLVPVPLGLRTSAGLGDRLGLATPGHVRAIRAAAPEIAPVFAQQSMREMARTGRSPREVIDAATWGAFEAGWTEAVGADADHVKAVEEVDACLSAGFTQFTIDPGAFVNTAVAAGDEPAVRAGFAALPWDRLEDSAAGLLSRYAGRRVDADGWLVAFDAETATRAAVKYGAAVAHVAALYRHLRAQADGRPFEVEVSVDETAEPTSHAEHVFIAEELRRLGVRWVALAPRFAGRFEKGVDYIGDLAEFERHLEGHAAIARALGPYKLSLHSGSDKFSLYPLVARHARGLVHLKTAGTSYLEALRVIASIDQPLFAEIYGFARERYDTDRASYHVSAELAKAPAHADGAAPSALLDQFHARQVLHVTFGSVLSAVDADGQPRFARRILAVLERFPDRYAEALEAHFVRHLAPFA